MGGKNRETDSRKIWRIIKIAILIVKIRRSYDLKKVLTTPVTRADLEGGAPGVRPPPLKFFQIRFSIMILY